MFILLTSTTFFSARSRDSSVGIETGYRPDGRGSNPGSAKVFFFFSQTSSGSNPASYPMGSGAISLGVKRPGRESDHSPLSSDEVKNGGAILSLPHVFMAYFLIK
jgi:hypothetical protein